MTALPTSGAPVTASAGPRVGPLVQPLRPDQLGDASTLFNTWQRIAGSFGIGLVAALYATCARILGPVAALHSTGLVLVALAAVGALGALLLPAVRSTAMGTSNATRAGGAAQRRARPVRQSRVRAS